MSNGSAGLRRWTHRFTIASGISFLIFLLTLIVGIDRNTLAIIGVFGFVCPMIFGMAYLLFPAYVKTTLVDQRLAGLHFMLAYAGAGLLVWSTHADSGQTWFLVGSLLWALGVAVFLGALVWTAAPSLLDDPTILFRSGDRPQRSTRFATAILPVALGYLIVGTGGLLSASGIIAVGTISLSQVIHYYAIGFGALLIFSLGARLLIGFFHVELPRILVWIVLLTGGSGPALLGTFLWSGHWFRVGAVLETVAMVGYLGVVLLVVWRTDRRRVGLFGILLGAVAGVWAVSASLPIAFGYVGTGSLRIHGILILSGFFPLTIFGYAYLFFPVSEGQFFGAGGRSARMTIGLLGTGVAVNTLGILTRFAVLQLIGSIISLFGAVGYLYLLARRFEGD